MGTWKELRLELLGKLPRIEKCSFGFVWPETIQAVGTLVIRSSRGVERLD